MSTAQISMIRMFSQRPSSTAGKESTALSQLKKVSLTRGQPGEVTTRPTTRPTRGRCSTRGDDAERRVRARR